MSSEEYLKEFEAPPDHVLHRAPTVWDVVRWPGHYIGGPGTSQAAQTQCDHGYRLLDSCPGCDADKEDLRDKLNL